MKSKLLQLLTRWLVGRAIKAKPMTHLYHDLTKARRGRVYMYRYNLLPDWMLYQHKPGEWRPKPWVPFWPRLHQIMSADLDRHMHDHPASFVSLVLSGGYLEIRPENPMLLDFEYGVELSRGKVRKAGSFAFRRFYDRHRITYLEKQTVTLFIFGRKRHWWGFYTEKGKVPHWLYPSIHTAGGNDEQTTQ